MPCILPIEKIHYILLYNGTELYKSKSDNKMYVRFIPDIFTKTIRYLFTGVNFFLHGYLHGAFYTVITRNHSKIIIYTQTHLHLHRYELAYYINNYRCVTEIKNIDYTIIIKSNNNSSSCL